MGITTLGDPIITIGIGVIVALVGWFGANMRMVLSAAMIWITLGLGSLLKLAFGRERPLTEYPQTFASIPLVFRVATVAVR